MVRKLPNFIKRDDYEKLLKAETDKRYKLAYMLGFESGLRISEIVGLRNRILPLTKSHVESNFIRIIGGKGKKDRITPKPKRFNASAISLLPLKITRRTLQHRITKLGLEVLQKHITFHTLRHGFVTECLSRGMDIHQVQMFAGHTRLDTTGIYLHANPEDALKRYEEVF